MKMKIKMLNEKLVLVDEYRLERFFKDTIYTVRESVGCYLINNKNAILISRGV